MKYQTFVAHRIGEIDELTNVDEWRWILSTLNPADNATRDNGNLSDQLSDWTRGPTFLHDDPMDWPDQSLTNKSPEPEEEKKKEFVTVITENEEIPLPDVERFSKWLRLIKKHSLDDARTQNMVS